jgi:hypothetical protein
MAQVLIECTQAYQSTSTWLPLRSLFSAIIPEYFTKEGGRTGASAAADWRSAIYHLVEPHPSPKGQESVAWVKVKVMSTIPSPTEVSTNARSIELGTFLTWCSGPAKAPKALAQSIFDILLSHPGHQEAKAAIVHAYRARKYL